MHPGGASGAVDFFLERDGQFEQALDMPVAVNHFAFLDGKHPYFFCLDENGVYDSVFTETDLPQQVRGALQRLADELRRAG